jgi:lysophospholipase L1-like esterase
MTRARKLIFAFAPLLGLLLVAEIGLRLFGYRYDAYFQQAFWWTRLAIQPIYERDAELFWRLRPHANSDQNPESRDTQAVNALGFRDDEFALEKMPGEFRIIALGDSCTFGDGVANWETYANVLEDLLLAADPERPVQVINAGVPGYTSYQVHTYLAEKLLAYQPDLVVVYVGFNDNVPAMHGVTDSRRGVIDGRAFWLQNVFGRLRTYQLLKYGLLQFKQRLLPNRNPDADNPEGVDHTFRVPDNEFVNHLAAIERLGERRGFKMVLVTLPHQFAKEPDRNKFIRLAAEQAKIPLVDLFPLMKEYQAHGESMFGPDGGHPNTLGHQRIAELIFAKLKEMGLAGD